MTVKGFGGVKFEIVFVVGKILKLYILEDKRKSKISINCQIFLLLSIFPFSRQNKDKLSVGAKSSTREADRQTEKDIQRKRERRRAKDKPKSWFEFT